MKYCSIASGSNGNSYYVSKGSTGILIDAGINSKNIHLRMQRLAIDPREIKAIFITHEHRDHICGLSVFARKYGISVYITEGSYVGSRLNLPSHLVHFIKADERTQIADLSVMGIPKMHDAKEPCSFVITDGSINIAILTDIGTPCANVRHVIQHSDVLLLESNFDEEMLEKGRYSYFLKNRIRSGFGHLSNRIALEVLSECKTSRLKHLILGHLSGENNRVEIVQETFESVCQDIKLSISTRYCETEMFYTEELIIDKIHQVLT